MKVTSVKDLGLIILLTAISTICITILPLSKYPYNIVSFILMAFFLPGYATVSLIFPISKNSKLYKRIFGAIAISLLITIIIIMMSQNNLINTSLTKIFIILGILTIIIALMAIYRRKISNKRSHDHEQIQRESSVKFSETLKEDLKSTKLIDDYEKRENIKIYRTKRPPIKDLYLFTYSTFFILTFLLISPTILQYFNSYISAVVSLLIFLLAGFSFIACLIPMAKYSKLKTFLLSLIPTLGLFVLFFFLLKYNPILKPNLFVVSSLSMFIGLMCIIALIRRIRIPRIKKRENTSETPWYSGEKEPTLDYDSTNIQEFIDSDESEEQEIESERIKSTDKHEPSSKIPIDNKKPSKVWFLDLFLVVLTTVFCLTFVLVPKLNVSFLNIITFLLLFLPGYSLIAVLYPNKNDLEFYERLSLSIGFPLIGLALGIVVNQISPVVIGLTAILIILSIFTIILVIIAFGRRRKKIKEKVNLTKQKTKKTSTFDESDESKKISSEHTGSPYTISKPRFFSMDLILILLTTILTIISIITPKLNESIISTILGLLLILFIAGYSSIAALFPKKEDLDSIERIALSFGVSIAVTSLIGFSLNYISFGIKLTPLITILSFFTLLMVLIAFIRRRIVQIDERFYVDFGGFLSSLTKPYKGESKTNKILSIILIIAIILAISTTVYITIKPKQGETFTEFYILGAGGTASDYPTNLSVGQNASLIIGIVNHENKNVDYQLIVTSNNVVMSDQNITVSNGNKTEIPYSFSSNTPGNKTIDFILYKLPDNTNVYRSLRLFVTVA